MNDKRGIEVYPGQFDEWHDGGDDHDDRGVVFRRTQLATLDELRAAISANFAILEMVNSGNWG